MSVTLETPAVASAVTITDRAATELLDLKSSQNRPGSALRIWVAGGGCSGLQYGMALDDDLDAEDQEFTHNGVKIWIDSLSLGYMEGAVVDYVDDVLGGGFKIENPNATASCGCGSSFKTEGSSGGGCGGGCGCSR
jgi:iron-sulfur cluster assembly protein